MFTRKSILFVLCFFSAISFAQESNNLQVEEMSFCTAIVERQPVGVDTAFANTVERIYCFTRITGNSDTSSISHVWYYKGEEKARLELKVKSTSWRTWSSKRMIKEWTGTWRVDVVTAGKVLKSKEFTIKSVSE